MKKINICIIGPDSIHTKRMVDYFLKQNKYVVYYFYYPVYKNIFQYVGILYSTLFRYLRIRSKVDITNIHYIGNFAFLISPFVKKNLVLTAWGSDVLVAPQKSKLTNFLFKKTLNKANRIIADGENSIDLIVSYNYPKSKTNICRFGIDTDKFNPRNKSKLDIKKTYPKYNNFIINLRNLEPVYNIETLIKSAKIVCSEKKDVLFLIYGSGSEKVMLQELVNKLGLHNNVLFLGRYSANEMQNILPNMDVYVSTSISDGGLAVSTSEAMACGVIPIVTDFGDNSKWVIEGKTGYLFPLKNERLLAKKILFVLNNKNKLKAINKNARDIIVHKLNLTTEMAKVDSIYKDLILNNNKK
jgi:glycosyltransferase involved in cell wall biosynthesis